MCEICEEDSCVCEISEDDYEYGECRCLCHGNKMTVHEFDKLVARRVFGFENVRGSYSTNDTAVRLVRNKIAELGLIGDFIGYLYARGSSRDFDLMQTTPREQCEAALSAISNEAME